jgi:carbonic anhydrase/acetyltransferase-like protein (isoleucine patch superfamily)
VSNIRRFGGSRPRIARDAWVDPAAVVIGDVAIGAGASLWPGVVARGDIHSIQVGDRTNIQDNSVLHVSHDSAWCPGGKSLQIGSDVTVGHRALLHGCRVDHHCLIGMGAIVMDGAVLGPHLILAAGSLVPEGAALEGGFLWLGTPARRRRPLTESELEYLDYSAAHYVGLAARHREAMARGG